MDIVCQQARSREAVGGKRRGREKAQDEETDTSQPRTLRRAGARHDG